MKQLRYPPTQDRDDHRPNQGGHRKNDERRAQYASAGGAVIGRIVLSDKFTDRRLHAEIEHGDISAQLQDQNPCAVLGRRQAMHKKRRQHQ